MTLPNLNVFLLLVLALGAVRGQLDVKVAVPLSVLPADLRLTSPVPPGIDMITCGGFWGKTGFVCDKTKTIAYAKDDSAKLKAKEALHYNIFDRFIKAFEITQPEYQKLFQANNYYLQPDNGLNYQSLANVLNNLRNQSPICWTLLNTIRSNSLCTTCSAENFKYYKDRLIGFGKQDCKNFLSTCNAMFAGIDWVSNKAQYLLKDFITLLEPSNSVYVNIFANGEVVKSMREATKLHWDLNAARYHKRFAEAERFESILCEKMVSVHKEPVLYKQIDFLNSAIDTFLREYGRITGRKLALRFAAPASRDLLLLSNPTGITPEQDVVYVPDATTDTAANLMAPLTNGLPVVAANYSNALWN